MAKTEMLHAPINLLSGEPIMRMSHESGTIYDVRTLTHIHNTVVTRRVHEIIIGNKMVDGDSDPEKEVFLRTATIYAVRLFGELTKPVKIHGQIETATLPLMSIGEDFEDIKVLKESALYAGLSKKRRKIVKERLAVIHQVHDIERKAEQPDSEGKTVELTEKHLEDYDKAVARIGSVVAESDTSNLDIADGDNVVDYDGEVWEVIPTPFENGNLPSNVQHYLLNAIWDAMSELGIITLVDDDTERAASEAAERRTNTQETEPDDDGAGTEDEAEAEAAE